jgi:hypothetical protein
MIDDLSDPKFNHTILVLKNKRGINLIDFDFSSIISE